jgi:hypothetical protein
MVRGWGLAPATAFADLAIATVAAMVPDGFHVRLCDENVTPIDLRPSVCWPKWAEDAHGEPVRRRGPSWEPPATGLGRHSMDTRGGLPPTGVGADSCA